MAMPTIQTSFSAGEIAPGFWGHIDYAKFSVGCATLRNYYVGYKGGAYSRAGTAFIGYSKQLSNNAMGSIYFSANPSPGDTIHLNGVLWTFVAGATTGTNIHIGGSCAFTIATLVTRLLASTNPLISVATYSESGGPSTATLVIVYDTPGSAGNAYTLTASAAVPSGATLTGGSSAPPRLITFQFSQTQGLCLEFGNEYMRVISGGGFVIDLDIAVLGISQTNPAIVDIADTSDLASGDWINIQNVLGMTEINNRTYSITVLNGTQFSLQTVFGDDVDATGYGAWTSAGNVLRIFTLETPYAVEDLKYLKFTQSADVMSLTCRNQETGTEYPPQELSRLSNENWTIAPLDLSADIDPPSDVEGTATSLASYIPTINLTGLTDYQYVVTAISMATGEESVASDIADIPDSVNIAVEAGSIVLTWTAVDGAAYYNIYKAPPAFQASVPIGSLFGFAGTTYGAEFVDSNIIQDMTQVPPLHKNPFAPGALISVTITDPGAALVPSTLGYTITTVHGTGAVGYPVVVGGEMQAFIFSNGGQNYADGDTIAFTVAGGVAASGSIQWSVNPSPGDTITLNGVIWTFVASGAMGNQTNIGANLPFTIGSLRINLNNSTVPALAVATYGNAGDTLNITYDVTGTIGNSYTLAASVATPSGLTLAGGAGGDVPSGTLNVGPEEGTYPSVVDYFQQRRVYANTANQPNTYFMSQPGVFTNFDTRIPTIDSDAITGAPWSVQVDGIQFMVPVLGGLIMLTGQAAYQVMGSGGSLSNPQPITPSSQQALPQIYNGCHAYVTPQKVDYDIVYLQSKGNIIRSMSYNFWTNVFIGVDLTFLSSHLFTGFGIEAMAWCEEPFKIMWVVRNDGALLSLTSMKTQDVNGWARHDTNGAFVGATSVSEPPVDALYLVTQRFLPDGRTPFMIERMNNRIWSAIYDAWCVDCAVGLTNTFPSVQVTASSTHGLGQPVDVVDLVGGTRYSSDTTVTVNDPAGTGCTVTPAIVNGVITGLTFSGGSGYISPTLSATDPQRLGSGFSGRVVLDNSTTFTASGPVFDNSMVGYIIRSASCMAQISAYVSALEVTAQMLSPVTGIIPNSGGQIPPFAAGTWLLDDTVSVITGLDHLVGMTVTGNADGNVITPRVVAADGSITLDEPAAQVIVGLGYQSQMQTLYLIGDSPTEQGARKAIPAATVRLEQSGAFKAGTNQIDGSTTMPATLEVTWVNMKDAGITGPALSQPPYGTADISGVTITRPTPLFTGDVRVPVISGMNKRGQVAIQNDIPMPSQILDIVREVVRGDLPEDEPKQRGD